MRPYAIVKMGGSLLTNKESPPGVMSTDLARLADEIIRIQKPIVVVHGLGSFGKSVLPEAGHTADFFASEELGLAVAFERSAASLAVRVIGAFLEHGAFAFGVAPSAVFSATGGAVSISDATPIANCLERGLLPVVRGGLLFDSLFGIVACSSDAFVAALALALRPEIVVFATDVEGVYDEWPMTSETCVIDQIGRLDHHLSSDHAAAEFLPQSSPMYSKVKSGLVAAAAAECRIVDGRIPGRLATALRRKPTPGTVLTNTGTK